MDAAAGASHGETMTAPITKSHRLSVARAWEGDEPFSSFVQHWVETGEAKASAVKRARLNKLAQLVADASPSPEAVAHGRALLLEIGGDSEECWQQNDATFENAAPLADALARVVGYPQRDEDGECFYPKPPEQP